MFLANSGACSGAGEGLTKYKNFEHIFYTNSICINFIPQLYVLYVHS